MAARLTFDREELKDLIRKHPDWSNIQYAAALSKPGQPPVRPNSVASAITRNRVRWESEGVILAHRAVRYAELIPWHGQIPPKFKMHTFLRHLRLIARARRGLPVSDES